MNRHTPIFCAAALLFCCAPSLSAQIAELDADLDDDALPTFSSPSAPTLRVTDLTVDLKPATTRASIERLSDNAVAWTFRAGDEPRRIEIDLHDGNVTRYYGMGERFTSLNHHAHILPLASVDQPAPKGASSYKPVPFFMTPDGYALWIDTTAPGTLDLKASERFTIKLSVESRSVRLVYIAGETMADQLAEFTRLVGRPRVPPAWSFGLWKSRDVHRSREEILEDVELLREHDIPASVLVIDSPWETCYNDFELNTEQFADPESMFARVEELGFYPCFWLTPFINTRNVTDMRGIDPDPCANLDEAQRLGHLVTRPDGSLYTANWWKGEGALVDFTSEAATEWWIDQLRKTLEWNVHALKLDDAEATFVDDAVFADGTPAKEMKGRYANLYREAAQRFIDEDLDGDGVMIARSGHAGSQAFPFGWAGDNETNFSLANGLPTAILAGQNAALSGLPMWGHDIGGYLGDRPTPELFVRWAQFGAFSPLMMSHMQANLGPWDFGPEALAIFRDFAKLHTQLFPYINAAAHEAAETGMPIIRPMALAFPDDRTAERHIFQYLFGPDLLVAPIYTPGTQRSVYIPAGVWFDWWTNEPIEGPREIVVDVPLDRIPLYARAGAIIEMLPDDVDTLIERHDAMADDVVAIDDRRFMREFPSE